jgi:hypothetical protein
MESKSDLKAMNAKLGSDIRTLTRDLQTEKLATNPLDLDLEHLRTEPERLGTELGEEK